jgi:hypothetical protein
MSELSTRADSGKPDVNPRVQAAKVAIMEMATTWAVRTALDSGFRRATGHSPPTARDPDVPYRRIIAWAAMTAAAVTAADIVADRVVLRPRPRTGRTPTRRNQAV